MFLAGSYPNLHKTSGLCNIIFVILTCFHLTNFFGEKKFIFSSADFFFSKIICQIKAGQNNKYKDLKSFSGLILPQIIFFCKFLSTFLAIVSSERMNLLDVMLQIELCPKTFAAVLAHVRSNIELTTCFHEFFKYESTNFFYQYISVENISYRSFFTQF